MGGLLCLRSVGRLHLYQPCLLAQQQVSCGMALVTSLLTSLQQGACRSHCVLLSWRFLADLLGNTPIKSIPPEQQLGSPRFELQVRAGGQPGQGVPAEHSMAQPRCSARCRALFAKAASTRSVWAAAAAPTYAINTTPWLPVARRTTSHFL